MRDIGKIFELWKEIQGIEEVLARELPYQDRVRARVRQFVEDQVVGISVHPFREEFLEEHSRLEDGKSIEFHFVCTIWNRSLAKTTTYIFTLVPGLSTHSVGEAIRGHMEVREVEARIDPNVLSVRWRHLVRVVRDFATSKLRIIIYNAPDVA